ncbi:hypothetical protein [Burkholderia sp. lig30]|jgi:hypothetical protein|uniref:hypothetical protein n=1 Tax=Burkholderia sp. lig30 TaxID=1192124 RepID=UPI0013661AC4|nr:hypothetical protein [Burkholderia sp. lig30]
MDLVIGAPGSLAPFFNDVGLIEVRGYRFVRSAVQYAAKRTVPVFSLQRQARSRTA